MTTLPVSGKGLTLLGAPGSNTDNDVSKAGGKVQQAMRLDLEEGVLQNILRSARSGGKGVHVSFGKTIVGLFTILLLFPSAILTLTIDTQLREQIEAIDGFHPSISYRALQLRLRSTQRTYLRCITEPSTRPEESTGQHAWCRRSSYQASDEPGLTRERKAIQAVSTSMTELLSQPILIAC